jgi:hypothetical protein
MKNTNYGLKRSHGKILFSFFNCSQHPKTRPSVYWMVIFRILFGSGFQMVTKWPTIQKQDWNFLTFSLYRLKNNILFINVLLIKRSRLVGTIWKPDKFVLFSNGRHLVLAIWKSDKFVRFWNGIWKLDRLTARRKSTIGTLDCSGIRIMIVYIHNWLRPMLGFLFQFWHVQRDFKV